MLETALGGVAKERLWSVDLPLWSDDWLLGLARNLTSKFRFQIPL